MASNLTNSVAENLAQTTRKQQFLRFSLEPNTTMMLPINRVTEVLKISLNQIVPIPTMPHWTMGVYNWRGEILWMADLGHLIGLLPWQQQKINPSRTTAIILSTERNSANKNITPKKLGLVIDRVEDIERCDPSCLQEPPASTVNSALAPFVAGYWLKPGGEMILALNSNSIMDAIS